MVYRSVPDSEPDRVVRIRSRSMVWVRCLGFFAVLASGGCSLLFDGSAYEDGADAGGADAGFSCRTHRDCLESANDTDYVCVPSPETPGSFFCASECTAAADCGAVGGGFAHDDGDICQDNGDCGCTTSANCLNENYPSCDREASTCEASDCGPLRRCDAPARCFGGRCQRWPCTSASDCADEPGRIAACVGLRGNRFCSDECATTADCPSGSTCEGTLPERRCTAP